MMFCILSVLLIYHVSFTPKICTHSMTCTLHPVYKITHRMDIPVLPKFLQLFFLYANGSSHWVLDSSYGHWWLILLRNCNPSQLPTFIMSNILQSNPPLEAFFRHLSCRRSLVCVRPVQIWAPVMQLYWEKSINFGPWFQYH